MDDWVLYTRTAINIATTLLYTAFIIHSIRELRRHKQRLDKFMVSTLVLLDISLAHTLYIDFAFIFDWPLDIHGLQIWKSESIYFSVFVAITIDIARLSLIILGLRRPDEV